LILFGLGPDFGRKVLILFGLLVKGVSLKGTAHGFGLGALSLDALSGF
jgi:hypothetical protein